MHPSDARREAQYRCSETCPAVWIELKAVIRKALVKSDWLTESTNVDTVTNDLTEVVMEAVADKGTNPLRAALVECEGERLSAEAELSEAKDEIKTLEDEVEEFQGIRNDLENQIADLQGQLRDADDRISELEN